MRHQLGDLPIRYRRATAACWVLFCVTCMGAGAVMLVAFLEAAGVRL